MNECINLLTTIYSTFSQPVYEMIKATFKTFCYIMTIMSNTFNLNNSLIYVYW
jgi:hypothetical protein